MDSINRCGGIYSCIAHRGPEVSLLLLWVSSEPIPDVRAIAKSYFEPSCSVATPNLEQLCQIGENAQGKGCKSVSRRLVFLEVTQLPFLLPTGQVWFHVLCQGLLRNIWLSAEHSFGCQRITSQIQCDTAPARSRRPQIPNAAAILGYPVSAARGQTSLPDLFNNSVTGFGFFCFAELRITMTLTYKPTPFESFEESNAIGLFGARWKLILGLGK